MKKIAAFATSILLVAGMAESVFAADNPRNTCIPLRSIDQSPVVNDSTIVLKLKNSEYKRIDLIAPCSGLKLTGGFGHLTHSDDLCTSSTLHVNDHMGVTCGIKQIVDISPDEAKSLTAHR